jgi:aspartate kinase
MKFGGTSVADPEGRSRLVEHVRRARKRGPVVCVVSAMGRRGEPYATDTLLGLAPGLRTDTRESDKLAACGEIISSVVVAHALTAAQIPARSLSGAEAGIVTDGRHGSASILDIDPLTVREILDEGLVPVVAGFQGIGPDGLLTTLGRGGSDTTACALAARLDASCVEIFTDVEGIMTADPADAPSARILDVVEYREVFQMARHGSRVVHAPAAEAAMEARVPLRVRSTFSEGPGTLVTDADGVAAAGRRRVATAVSHVDDVARFRVLLPRDDESGDHMAAQTAVYRTMAEAGVSLDMFTPCGDHMVFSTSDAAAAEAGCVLDGLDLPHDVEPGLAKVTLIGAGMHGVPGVMARLASSLAERSITIRQVADSHATISVLVCQNRRHEAVEALHEAFELGGDPQPTDRSATGEDGS